MDKIQNYTIFVDLVWLSSSIYYLHSTAGGSDASVVRCIQWSRPSSHLLQVCIFSVSRPSSSDPGFLIESPLCGLLPRQLHWMNEWITIALNVLYKGTDFSSIPPRPRTNVPQLPRSLTSGIRFEVSITHHPESFRHKTHLSFHPNFNRFNRQYSLRRPPRCCPETCYYTKIASPLNFL